MHRSILVPLDGSSAADAVIPHVLELVRGVDARVTLLRVIEPAARAEVIDEGTEPPRFRTEKIDDARRHLERVRNDLKQRGVDAEVLLMRGVAVDGICQACARVGADLLAMTARGRSSLTRALLGNVALGVLNRAPCPIFVAPIDTHDTIGPLRRILVPLDGSTRAESALPHAEALAQARGASVLLLRVVRTGYQTTVFGDVDREIDEAQLPPGLLSKLGRHQDLERLREAQAYLRDLRASLQTRQLDVDACVSHGRPTESILALADDADVDLVVLTNHLRSGLASILYGSVASGLLGRLARPMLIVPTGERPARNFV